MKRLTAVTAGLGCLLVPLVVVPTAALTPSGLAVGTAAPPSPARIAFTDDRDELALQRVRRFPNDNLNDVQDPGDDAVPADQSYVGVGSPTVGGGSLSTEHEGEAGVVIDPRDLAQPDTVTFVSNSTGGGADDPDGEVVLDSMADGGHDLTTRSAVTCENDARETHPQLNPNSFQVVYASDRVTEESPEGDWELYVASFVLGLAPTARAAPQFCNGWLNDQVTDNTSDDLWPTWVDNDTLVYSSTEEDSLGDIWTYTLGADAPVRQTDSPAAETQPVAVTLGNTWYVFTTTEFRPDGSLGYVAPAEAEPNPANSLFDGDAQQSSEAAWTPSNGAYLAFTSTEEDPYGDVWITNLVGDVDSGGSIEVGSQAFPVADEPGVAESHASWRNVFNDDPSPEPPPPPPPPPSDPGINRPPPFGQAGHAAPGLAMLDLPGSAAQDEYAELLITRRSMDADITDVRADSTDRRVLVDREGNPGGGPLLPLDEAGPSYSPDGSRIAFSSDFGVGLEGRGIMLADADGTSPEFLAAATSHDNGDVDLDPAWSPDGTRLAFTRYPSDGEGLGPPEVWVVDGVLGPAPDAHLVSVTVPGVVLHDTDPTWSPDGQVVVLSRAREFIIGRPAARAGPLTSPEQFLWAVEANGSGQSAQLVIDDCQDGCDSPIRGRSPAWSPDGTEIAYDDRGALRIVLVDPAGPTDAEVESGQWFVESGRAVTGFRDSEQDAMDQAGLATPSRGRISVAEDPAWSPDGTEIAFAGQPAGQADQRGIWAITPEGTGLRRVTDARGPETEPAWQSSAADLAVTVAVSGSPAQVGDPVTTTYTLTNSGPGAARDVTLTTVAPVGGTVTATILPPGCAADGTGCTLPDLAPGASLTYEVTTTWPAPVNGTVVGRAASTTDDPDLTNNRDAAAISVAGGDVRVRVELDDPVGYVGGERTATFVVENRGPLPADQVELQATYPSIVTPVAGDEACLVTATPCNLGTLGPDDDPVRFEVTLDTDTEGGGEIQAAVTSSPTDPDPTNNEDLAALDVLKPRIQLLPAVARPGMVVLAFGEDMPPGSRVRLKWRRGITVDKGPFRVERDGTMRASLLIVRRDRLGKRKLDATSTTSLFSPVRGPLLVATRMMTPPDFRGRG